MHYNKTILVGNLGDDAETRSCSNGALLFKLRVATGEEWHSVEYFAETEKAQAFLRERLLKGSQVFVEGEIATDKWNDRDGKPRVWKKIKARVLMPLRESLRNASTFEGDGIPGDYNPDEPGREEPAPQERSREVPASQAPQANGNGSNFRNLDF